MVDLVRALIRFDTSNTGDLATTKGEAECARWVAEQLQEVGYETEYIEAGAPGRANVFTRLKGADRLARRPDAARAPRRGARRGRRTGVCTRSPVPSRTATSGVAARST